MKRLVSLVAGFLILAGSAGADIPIEPHNTLLWNRFSAVTVVDSFAVASGNNGLMVLKRTPGENLYREGEHLFLAAEGVRHKRRDSVLAVGTEIGVIYFFNLAALPAIELIGMADVGESFEDFTWSESELYLARGFDGLWRYQLSGYSSPSFLDSSMTGIHCVTVEIDGDYLYSLDDYNGVLRYDLTAPGFGQFLDYLYLPFRAHSFTLLDSLVVVAGTNPEVFVGTFAGGARLLDTIPTLFPPDAIFARDTLIAAFSKVEPAVELISAGSGAVFTALMTVDVDSSFAGSIYTDSNGVSILLPSATAGLVEYPLSRMAGMATPVKALARPGPVTSLLVHDETLHTSGDGNPVDRYDITPHTEVVYDTTYYPGIVGGSAMAANGDTLFVYYQEFGRVFVFEAGPDSLFFLGSVRPNGLQAREIHYNPHPFDTLTSFYVVSNVLVELFSVSDSSGFLPQGQVGLVDDILDAVVVDSLMFLASKKSGMVVFRIYNDLTVEFRRTLGLSFQPTSLTAHDGRLFVFFGNELSIYTVGDPDALWADTTISVYREVIDCSVSGHHLYTVGPSGIAIYDIARPVPQLMAEGGRPGYHIAADSELVAISDSVSLHLYRVPIVPTGIFDNPTVLPAELVLHQNYPNPFNPETIIRFALPRQSEVRLTVYNLLGQHVRELINERRPAGEYEIRWDGTVGGGERAATGVYFYRLETELGTQTRKMLLLK